MMCPIYGEQFDRTEEDNTIWLVHPQWGLVGYGKTCDDAQAMVIADALDIYQLLEEEGDEEFSDQLARMRKWVKDWR